MQLYAFKCAPRPPPHLLLPPPTFHFLFQRRIIVLDTVLQADLRLQSKDDKCWTAQLIQAFQGLRDSEFLSKL
eukprot:538895-Pelagomonas_calceolata.AAC.5